MNAQDLARQLTASPMSDGVVWAATDAAGTIADLRPEERPAMQRARPGRIAEFVGGRRAARMAMAALGVPVQSVPMGPDRAPIWPNGLVGSISHADGICIAALATDHSYTALGIDLAAAQPMAADLANEIAGPDEITSAPLQPTGLAATRVFSAKEAIYKAVYPNLRQVLDFQAFTLAFTDSDGGYALAEGDLATILPLPVAFRQSVIDRFIVSFCAQTR